MGYCCFGKGVTFQIQTFKQCCSSLSLPFILMPLHVLITQHTTDTDMDLPETIKDVSMFSSGWNLVVPLFQFFSTHQDCHKWLNLLILPHDYRTSPPPKWGDELPAVLATPMIWAHFTTLFVEGAFKWHPLLGCAMYHPASTIYLGADFPIHDIDCWSTGICINNGIQTKGSIHVVPQQFTAPSTKELPTIFCFAGTLPLLRWTAWEIHYCSILVSNASSGETWQICSRPFASASTVLCFMCTDSHCIFYTWSEDPISSLRMLHPLQVYNAIPWHSGRCRPIFPVSREDFWRGGNIVSKIASIYPSHVRMASLVEKNDYWMICNPLLLVLALDQEICHYYLPYLIKTMYSLPDGTSWC